MMDDIYVKPVFTGNWEEDNFIMTNILDAVEFYSGTERKKMLKVPKSIGGSMLYGLTWRGYLSPTKNRTLDPETGLYFTKVVDVYPELKDIFREFANKYFPKHQWEQVQMNKNFPCPVHRDSSNISESILCCFGDYEGGLTGVKYEVGTKYYDARESPIKFNGAKYEHWVQPVLSGTRYSLVFFSNKSVKKLIEKKKNNILY